jgi:uncharacterized Fe-S cluster protein YjdI
MLGATSGPCFSLTLLARTCQIALAPLGNTGGEFAAAPCCSLLQQQAVLLRRMLRTDASSPAVTPAAASAQQQPQSTAAPIPASAGQKLNPLQPYIPPGLVLPKAPGSSSAVRTAEFAAGAYSAAQLPPERWPEVAVVGRSNVGKSSLINCMLGSSSLAKISKHPGATPHAAAAAAAASVLACCPCILLKQLLQRLLLAGALPRRSVCQL